MLTLKLPVPPSRRQRAAGWLFWWPSVIRPPRHWSVPSLLLCGSYWYRSAPAPRCRLGFGAVHSSPQGGVGISIAGQAAVTASRSRAGAKGRTVGRGRGAGVVVKAHPAAHCGVTVEDRKTICRCWDCGSIGECRKGDLRNEVAFVDGPRFARGRGIRRGRADAGLSTGPEVRDAAKTDSEQGAWVYFH